MRIPAIIGLHGLSGSGKDAAGEILCGQLGYSRVALADEVRADLLILNPQVGTARLSEIIAAIGWPQAQADYPEIRRLLQVYGTEVQRRLDVDVWIHRIQPAMRTAMRTGGAIITDVRFDNEAWWVHHIGGWVLQVVGRGGLDDENAEHVSEGGIDAGLIHGVIVNDGALEDLPRRITELLDSLKGNQP